MTLHPSLARDPRTVDLLDFPRDGSDGEKLAFLLNYAVLAPSGHNTQPWLFRLHDDNVEIHADRRRALPVVDPFDRELMISCGAAMEGLCVALRHFSYDAAISPFPVDGQPDFLARVKIAGAHTPEDRDTAMFQAIPRRETVRRAFSERQPDPAAISAALGAADDLGVSLILIDRAEQRHALAGLIAEGDRIQFDDPHFRRELAAWIHSRRSTSRDGVSGAGFGMPDLLSPVGAFIVRTFDVGDQVAAGHEAIADHSPLLAVFATETDTETAWIATGRALMRVLLITSAAGIDASYLNQPIEVADLRPKLQAKVGGPEHPQLLVRFGYAEPAETPPSVRRTVSDCVI